MARGQSLRFDSRRRTILTYGALALATVSLGCSAFYRAEYGAWVGSPQRIPYCDRSYYATGKTVTWQQARSAEAKSLRGSDAKPLALVTHEPAFLGTPVYGPVGEDGAVLTIDLTCSLKIYRKIGDDSYQVFRWPGGDLPFPGPSK